MNAEDGFGGNCDFRTRLEARKYAFRRILLPVSMLLLLSYSLPVTGGELVSDRPWRDATAEGLIVVTHGWQKGSAIKGGITGELGDLYSVLSSALDYSNSWNLAAYHWENTAATGGVWPTPSIDGHANATTAAANGVLEAATLVSGLRKFTRLKKLHLIAHSAGTWVMDETIRRISIASPNLTIQLTLLDPFIPDAGAAVFGIPTTGLSTARISNLASLAGDNRIFLLENYFTVDSATATSTEQIFNWQGRNINYRYRPGLLTELDPLGSGHSAPIVFYTNTVRFTQSPYPASLNGIDPTAIGWQKGMFFNEIAFSEPPESRDLYSGQTAIFSATAFQRGRPGRSQSDFTYQWEHYLNGSWQSVGGNQSLILIPTTASMSGRKYRVTASIGSDRAVSNEVVLTLRDSTIASAPAAPTNLVATAASSSRINLTWQDRSSNESGFKVKRRLSGSSSWTEIATLAAGTQSYSSSGLAASTTYDYQVYAFNSVEPPAASNIASARTSALATTGIPLTVNALDLSAGQTLAVSMYSWEGTLTDFRSNTTTFTRSAAAGTQITVSAPATLSGGRIFQYWLKDGSVREYNTSLTVTMDGQHVVDAIYGTTPPSVRTLQSIAIVGPSSVDERTAASYSVRATYTDGTTGTVSATWSDNSTYASISSNGLLDAAAVSSDKSVTLTATATVSGVTKSTTKSITIRNMDAAPTYTLNLYAENGHISASPDLGSYEAGTEVRLTAYPDDNYMRSHWSGDASGTERTVYVTMNGNKSVTAHFVLDTRTADVTVDIEPAAARAEGAGFKIGGEGSYVTNWQPPGDTVYNRKAGDHRIWFKDLPGWITPEDIRIEIAGGLPIRVTGTYREVPGTVQVNISPAAAAAAGARWRIDSGPWNESGTTLPSVTPGSHRIEFLAVAGWTTPVAQNLTVNRGGANSVSGAYGPPAGFPIISAISPKTGPISGGTEVTINGVNFSQGATVTFGGIPAVSLSVENSNRILAMTPPRASYGTVPVTVSSGQNKAVVANGFSYLEPPGSNMELVGQIGGSFLSVAVLGNLAYIGEGTSLVILDITNPAAPVERGRLALPNSVYDIEVGGGFAYVANGSSGLFVIDVSTPTAPLVTGFYDTPGITYDLALGNGIVYAADGSSGLQVIDVSVPSSPTLAGAYATPTAASRVQTGIIGMKRIASIGGMDEGVRVVDVTNGAAPVELAYIPPPSTEGVRDLRLIGSTLYVAFPYAVRIIDLTNPDNPLIRSTFSTIASCLDVANGRAYVCDGPLYVLNVSNPSTPSEISNFEVGYYPERIRVSGQYAFIAFGREGFKVINISNPASPALATTIKGVGAVNGVKVRGNLALTGNDDGGVDLVDVTYPASPAPLAHLGSERISHLDVSGNTSVLVNYGDETVRIMDISTPETPIQRSTYTTNRAWDVAYLGTRPVIAGSTRVSPYKPVIDVLDLSNPISPQRHGYLQLSNTAGTARGICFSGSWGFVITTSEGLHVVDFANPAAPSLVSTLALGNNLLGVTSSMDGNYVYVADSALGVRVIDVTIKSAPVAISTLDPPQSTASTTGVRVSGNRLVVLDQSFVYVYSLVDPASPIQVAYYDLPRVSISGSKIDIVGDLVYIAAGSSGLMILEIGDLELPTVSIGAPTVNASYSTLESSITIGGTASDNRLVTRIVWKNDFGSGGVAEGTTSWTIPRIQLAPGVNRITVTAEDAEGNLGTDVIEVTSTPPDTTPPVLAITGPTTATEHATIAESTTLVGSVADDRLVQSVGWTTSAGQSGPATLTGQTWMVEGLPLETGLNFFTVTATDATGNSSSDSITILRVLPDTANPSIAITFPTQEASLETRSGRLDLSGSASDAGGLASVTWSSNRSGAGTAEGTALWVVSGINLKPGVNILTITAVDAAGNSEEDSLTVIYTPHDSDGDDIADDWEMEHFGTLTVASVSSDYGNRGVKDVMKYALGINPLQPDALHIPYVKWRTNGFQSPVLHFRRLIAPMGLTYRVDVSADGVKWDGSGSKVEAVGITSPTGDGVTENVMVRLRKEAVATIRFYRLSIGSTGSTATTTYKLAIPPGVSSVSTLRSLVVSAGQISPIFASGTTAYALSVANKVTRTTVTPTVTHAGARVKVNGTTVASGSASRSIPLAVGSNKIIVEVTAQDGVTKRTYTVTVNRARSRVATLKALTLSAGPLTPEFAAGTTSYALSVANAVAGTTVTPTVTHAGARVKVNGTTVASGSASPAIPLVVGANTITVEVTAQDGKTKRTYTVTATRAASPVAKLKRLEIEGANLSPGFTPGRTNYEMVVGGKLRTIRIRATVRYSTDRIMINGVRVKSGTWSGPITIRKEGTTLVRVVVIASNGTKRTYRLNFARKE